MKFAVAALIATAVSANDVVRSKFVQYMAQFGKNYLTVEEFNARKEIFEVAENFIASHNSTSFTVGHNKFSDMTDEEKAKMRGRNQDSQMRKFTANYSTLDVESIPESIDWRTLGAVNEIQDQGRCGSCWAFSSCASLEGAHFIATGELLKFSEQSLVDCAKFKWGNLGCGGGLEQNSFTYWESNDAILEADYPYTAKNGDCVYDSTPKTNIEVITYTDVPEQDASGIKAAIAQQPISVAIEADKLVFQLYTSGIFDSTSCGTSLDHAVALVGYGTENGQEYFILRNSWGTSWGESGYMKIANAGDGNDGICGVALAATYPTSN